MEGVDHGFGLPGTSAGSNRLEEEWAAMCAALGVRAESQHDAAAIVASISNRPQAARRAAMAFQQIAAAADVDAAPSALVRLMAGVLAGLPLASLERVLAAMEAAERTKFTAVVAAVVEPRTVYGLCVAAGAAFERPLSAPLQRLLRKMRTEAEQAAPEQRERAVQSLRELVLQISETWAAATVKATANSFETMFGDEDAGTGESGPAAPECLRILQLSLESGAMGLVVWGAVAEQTRSEEGMRELLEMLKQAPADNEAARAILGQIATPGRLVGVLREQPPDLEAVDVLIGHMGVAAARPLIDELAEAKLRTTRRDIMDRLVQLGPAIEPFVVERLADHRWYVVRNMILLLREAGCPLDSVPLQRFQSHSDARVRREMLQFRLDDPQTRGDALAEAFMDSDRNVLKTAIHAARTELPEAVVPVLARRVADAAYPAEFRAMTLLLLGRSGSPAALDTLLAFVEGGRTLLGRTKLAPGSPEMLAALSGLARSWPQDARVRPLLDMARKSKDPQIVNALRSTQRTS
jgi:hypothetical protein